MKIAGFDNDAYVKMQSEKITERIAKFGGKLYLEFGGSLMTSMPPAYFRASSRTVRL